MKKLFLLFSLSFVLHGVFGQSVIHVKSKKTLDIEALGSLYGIGGVLGYSYYLGQNSFIQSGIHFESAKLDFTQNYDLMLPITYNYSIVSRKTLYFNLRGGLFFGEELLQNTLIENEKKQNFSFGCILGSNIEYWPSYKMAFVAGIEQWLRIKSATGNKIIANVGIKIALN